MMIVVQKQNHANEKEKNIQGVTRQPNYPDLDWSRSVVPDLESPDVLGVQLPEILASTFTGEGFCEFSPRTSGDPRLETTALGSSVLTGPSIPEAPLDCS